MYSERIILAKLARFQARYGWTPQPHTVEQVIEMNSYIKSLNDIGKDGRVYFDEAKLTPQLKRWIENERAMCAIDCAYYLTRYHFIIADNEVLRFSFRSGQKVFYAVCQELEEQGKSIEIQTLKARQQGISTLVEGMITHRVLFVPGVKCSVASANPQKTQVMLGMLYTALEHLPWWLPPKLTTDRRSGAGLMEFSAIGSSVVVQSGSMRGGIGQGTTPTVVHLSEVCDYTDSETQIEEGLFRAVHPSPNIFMVLESTGNGNTGWWAEQWKTNKEFYWQGRSRLLPLFLPWFMTPELFPTPTWIHKYPIPESWNPVDETIAMTAKCEAYVRMTPIIAAHLPPNWRLPREQQWFWEFNYLDAKRRRTERKWLRQMPCDDFEALTGDRESAFDWDTLQAIENHRQRGFSVYGIIGEGIAEKHDPPPERIDPEASRHYSSWVTPKGERLEWGFMPYMLNKDEEENTLKNLYPLKKLIVYEFPQRRADYSLGVDTSQGKGMDRFIVEVLRTGRDSSPDVQVAEFAADDITDVEAYAYVAAIASFYGIHMEESQIPKLCIEQRRKTGDTCQHQLLLMGMKRHHVMIAYDRKTNKPKPTQHSRLGFFTGSWSRPMLLNVFRYAVENGWIILHSPFLLEEMKDFEINTDGAKPRLDHQKGKHDDRIFAMAMAYFTMHDLDIMIERAKKKFNATPISNEYIVNYAPATVSIPGVTLEQWNEFRGLPN